MTITYIYWGFTFEGYTVRGERTSPTLPQTQTLMETQSTMVSEKKVWICSQIRALPRWMGGGRSALYGVPRKFSLKGLKKCSTWIPSRIMPIRSTQNEWLWISLALKYWGLRKRSWRKDTTMGRPATIPGEERGPTKGQVPWFISQKGTYVEDEREATLTTPEKNELIT